MRTSWGKGIVGLLSFWSTIITVNVAEPANRGLPLSVAVTTSLWVDRKKSFQVRLFLEGKLLVLFFLPLVTHSHIITKETHKKLWKCFGEQQLIYRVWNCSFAMQYIWHADIGLYWCLNRQQTMSTSSPAIKTKLGEWIWFMMCFSSIHIYLHAMVLFYTLPRSGSNSYYGQNIYPSTKHAH